MEFVIQVASKVPHNMPALVMAGVGGLGVTEVSDKCHECGASIPDSGSCHENLNAMLAMEGNIPGGAGTRVHFFAVSSYILQHPQSMCYSVDSLEWLRSSVASALSGLVTTEDLGRGALQEIKSSGAVLRRGDDAEARFEFPQAWWRRHDEYGRG
jgi:hypothetical protein